MQPNRVKKILKSGGIAIGTYVGGIADPQIVEIIGHTGFDAAFIDMEHTSFDLSTVQLMVMAAERVGITPTVRPPGFDPAFLLRLLDMGVGYTNFAPSPEAPLLKALRQHLQSERKRMAWWPRPMATKERAFCRRPHSKIII